MNTNNITLANLAQFYGSEQLYFHPLFRFIKYTEGVRFLNHNGAGWLVDLILSTAPKYVKKHEFIHVRLKVDVSAKTGIVTFDDGNNKVFFTHILDYTDFPLPEISFYVENGVLMLPSER